MDTVTPSPPKPPDDDKIAMLTVKLMREAAYTAKLLGLELFDLKKVFETCLVIHSRIMKSPESDKVTPPLLKETRRMKPKE